MKPTRLCAILIAVLMTSCMEDYNDRYFLKEHFVEFEEATMRGKALGKDYVVANGKVTADGEGVVLQVNLVGAQLDVDQAVKFQVVTDETTAVAGRDYTLSDETSLAIPANSSFGYITVSPTATGEGETLLVLELLGNELIKPSENYKKLAVICSYP